MAIRESPASSFDDDRPFGATTPFVPRADCGGLDSGTMQGGRMSPVLQQIAALGELPPNWNSYGAAPVDPKCVALAADFLIRHLKAEHPLPAVVPTCGGGVQLEWHSNGVDLEVETLSATELRFSFEDLRTGETVEADLADDLQPLVDLMRRL